MGTPFICTSPAHLQSHMPASACEPALNATSPDLHARGRQRGLVKGPGEGSLLPIGGAPRPVPQGAPPNAGTAAPGETVPYPFPKNFLGLLGSLHLDSNLSLPLGEARVSAPQTRTLGRIQCCHRAPGALSPPAPPPQKKRLTGLSSRSSCAVSRPLTRQMFTEHLLMPGTGQSARVTTNNSLD